MLVKFRIPNKTASGKQNKNNLWSILESSWTKHLHYDCCPTYHEGFVPPDFIYCCGGPKFVLKGKFYIFPARALNYKELCLPLFVQVSK